jgi:uncharacterized protein (TIGR03437 family)
MKPIHICFCSPSSLTVGGAQTLTIRAPDQQLQQHRSPGLPRLRILRGSIFVIYGSNLAPKNSGIESVPLKTTLNGVSISVTVNGATTNPLFLAQAPSQIDAILPSATRAGTGTITLTNNGATSAAAPIEGVETTFGILTLSQEGTGMASVLMSTATF